MKLFDFEESDDSLINLTPLIDVVFVVLIVFILMAPLVEIDSISLAPGSRKTAEKPFKTESNAIHIDLQKDGTVRINKREIDKKDLKPLLNALHDANTKGVPKLFCDKEVAFGTYQEVKNAVEDAGFETLDIVVAPQ